MAAGLLDHPRFAELARYSKAEPATAILTAQVFIDLCDVKNWSAVGALYSQARRSLFFLRGQGP